MTFVELHAELKEDIDTVTTPLVNFSKKCIKKRGAFLPHGAYLDAYGNVELVMAGPENDLTNAIEVLPLLHEALRAKTKVKSIVAFGVAEDVIISRKGELSTRATKILFEHKRGLVIAQYFPFKKKFFRGFSFDQSFWIDASGEVNAWQESNFDLHNETSNMSTNELSEFKATVGRQATEEDIKTNSAVFVLRENDSNKLCGKPIALLIPQYALHTDENKKVSMVVLIQAETYNGIDYCGCVVLSDRTALACTLAELKLLGKSTDYEK